MLDALNSWEEQRVFLYQPLHPPSHGQDVALLMQIAVVSRPLSVFPSLEKPPPAICLPNPTVRPLRTAIEPVRTCDRLRGDRGLHARLGRMFGSQRDFGHPSNDFQILLLGCFGLFSRGNAPGDPRLYENQSVLRRKHLKSPGDMVCFVNVDYFIWWVIFRGILVQIWETEMKQKLIFKLL